VSAPIILAAVRWTVPALCALLLLAGCGGDDDKPASTATAPAAARVTCKKVAAPAPKGEQNLSKPKGTLEPGKRYDVDLQTNCGTITIRLATGRAPRTSASFADLVKRGFYDGLTFHRIVHDFVIQGGDPLGTGMGGPGYTVVEKPPADLAYTTGIVAMAKTEADPTGASGSQFFIVTAADAGLPPDYAVAGGVVRGMNVAQHIGTLPVNGRDRPTSPVVIEKATLRTE
jgi:peptidyl-prolyl cis-trans isomerase B (cyclophilin B)